MKCCVVGGGGISFATLINESESKVTSFEFMKLNKTNVFHVNMSGSLDLIEMNSFLFEHAPLLSQIVLLGEMLLYCSGGGNLKGSVLT